MSRDKLTFERFRVWQVVVPARQDILSAPASQGTLYAGNLSWPALPIHLVEGLTSHGFTAVGECDRGTPRTTVEATLQDLLGRDLATFSPRTVWMGPSDEEGLPQSYPLWSWQTGKIRSYPLLESLWVDAVAKAAGLPAHGLLGGAVRSKVATDFWANRPSPQTLVGLVQEATKRGLRGMKMKCDSTGDTVQSLMAGADRIPDHFRFTIDPMLAWRSRRESLHLFQQLSTLPFPIQIEDPFPYEMADDWRAVRRLPTLTIACHARSEAVLRTALREELADVVNVGGGSAYDFLHMARVAEFHHKDCWQGSSLELGVLQHLRLHAAACARNCLLSSDLQSEWVREHTLVTPRMAYAGGHTVVPTRPGLGVDLDHAAIMKYSQEEFTISDE